MQTTIQQRGESEAIALRVFAGNGFGDAPIGRSEPHVLLSSDLYHLARAQRSYHLRKIVKATVRAAGDVVRRMAIRWKHEQRARATYAALRSLDACVLRDLGFHRSELMSVAAEVAGMAESTRARLLPVRANCRA